jgi:ectoine hydroxylase
MTESAPLQAGTDSTDEGDIDPYPSRGGRTAGLLPRRDPVPWCATERPAGGPLDPDALRFFAENGFVTVESLLSESEVGELRDALARLSAPGGAPDERHLIREPGGNEVRSVFYVHRTCDVFKRLARDERTAGIARQLLDSDVYVHQSRVNLKPAFHGKEFYWHSDFETWHVEDGMPRMRAVSCSINLTHNSQLNGALMLIPGSHRVFVACAGTTPENHYERSLRRQEYGVPEHGHLTELAARGGIVAPTGAPGSAVFFDCNVMHGSNGNITPHPRSNVFLVYNSTRNTLVEPYSGMAPRPEFVATRDFTPVDRL